MQHCCFYITGSVMHGHTNIEIR